MELLLELYYKLLYHFNEDTIEGGGLLFFTFVLGNLFITLFAGLFCFLTKKIQIIYDTFGVIVASSIMATMVNMVLLMPLVFFQFSAVPVFYIGCIITAACYGFILYNFNFLNSLGKKLSKKQ